MFNTHLQKDFRAFWALNVAHVIPHLNVTHLILKAVGQRENDRCNDRASRKGEKLCADESIGP